MPDCLVESRRQAAGNPGSPGERHLWQEAHGASIGASAGRRARSAAARFGRAEADRARGLWPNGGDRRVRRRRCKRRAHGLVECGLMASAMVRLALGRAVAGPAARRMTLAGGHVFRRRILAPGLGGWTFTARRAGPHRDDNPSPCAHRVNWSGRTPHISSESRAT